MTTSPLLPSPDDITTTPMYLGTSSACVHIVVAAPTQLHDELLVAGLKYARDNPGWGNTPYPYKGVTRFCDAFNLPSTTGIGKWELAAITHTREPHCIEFMLRFPRGKNAPDHDACVQFALDLWPKLTSGWRQRRAQAAESDAQREAEAIAKATDQIRRDALAHIRREFRSIVMADADVMAARALLEDAMETAGRRLYYMNDDNRRAIAMAAMPPDREGYGLKLDQIRTCSESARKLVEEALNEPDPAVWALSGLV